MKLFFCDICNESIPLQDIKENAATTIKGKIFCRKCNPLNELGAATPGATAPRGSHALSATIAVLLLLVLAALGWLIAKDVLAGRDRAAQPDAASRDDFPAEERFEALAAEVDELREALAAGDASGDVAGRVAALSADLTARATDIERARGDIAQLQQALQGAGAARERTDRMALLQEELGQKLDQALARLATVETTVKRFDEEGFAGAAGPSNGAAGMDEAPREPEAAAAPKHPELPKILEQLASKEATERWAAVDQIRRLDDEALIPYVLQALDDRDTFVRAQAIYTLGELRATDAVPKLIKLLRDDELMIREEAQNGLIVITGQNMRFEVDGSRDVREKGIRRWETWLAEHEDEL